MNLLNTSQKHAVFSLAFVICTGSSSSSGIAMLVSSSKVTDLSCTPYSSAKTDLSANCV